MADFSGFYRKVFLELVPDIHKCLVYKLCKYFNGCFLPNGMGILQVWQDSDKYDQNAEMSFGTEKKASIMASGHFQ